MSNYSPLYAFLTLKCLTGNDADDELAREPFFQTDELSEPELESLAGACNLWLQKLKYIEFQVMLENSRASDAARLVYLRWRLDDITRIGAEEVFDRRWADCFVHLQDDAEKFVNALKHARAASIDTYYVLADSGRGFFACTRVDSLTHAEFCYLFNTLLCDRAREAGFILDWVSVDCPEDAPMSVIQAKQEWEAMIDDDENDYYKLFLERKCGGWDIITSLTDRLVSEVELHRGKIDFEAWLIREAESETAESPVEVEAVSPPQERKCDDSPSASGFAFPIPKWDSEKFQLEFGGEIIRKLSRRSTEAVKIIQVFEEDGWPVRIDSPFPPDENGKMRRRDSIRTLNENLLKIRFESDGSGEGVIWKIAPEEG